ERVRVLEIVVGNDRPVSVRRVVVTRLYPTRFQRGREYSGARPLSHCKMSSLSVSTRPASPFVRCSSRSVVFPMALTTTTTRFPRAYSSDTDATARLILFGFDKLNPPNLTTSRRRRWWEEDGRQRDEEGGESWSVRIWCLGRDVEAGVGAALT